MTSKLKYSIIGASGHAGVIIDELIKIDPSVDIILFDDNLDQKCIDYSVSGSIDDLILQKAFKDRKTIIGIGENIIRKEIYNKLRNLNGIEFSNVISRDAAVSKFTNLGNGNLIVAGALINHGVTIGNNSIVNSLASIDHDCIIGSNVHVAPGVNLAGNVCVGDDVLIGIGSSIAPNITIGKNCVIGAGSVVIRDIEANSKVFGNPAHEKK